MNTNPPSSPAGGDIAWLTRFGAIGRALSERNFGIYTAANVPSQIGSWVQRVAVGWLTWELTRSGIWLGLMGFADLFPIVVVSPFAGVIADRFDRLALAKIIQTVAALQAAALAVLTFSGLITVELLFLFTLIAGIDQAFYQPVRQAMAPNLVRRGNLPAAIAINSITWNIARFVGPAVAGLILVAGDAGWAFALNTVTYGFLLYALWCIRLTPDPETDIRRKGLRGDLTEGYRYALGHRHIGPLFLILGVGAVAARPVTEFLPGFADRVFGMGPEALAIMTSAMGVGAMAAGVWLGARGRLAGLTSASVHALLASGVLLCLFATTGWFPLAVVCLAGIGFFQVTIGTAIQTLVQTIAVASMRGRVLAVYGLLWLGGASIGAVIMGIASEWVGLQGAIFAGGVICALVWLWGLTIRRALAREIEGPEGR